MRASFQKNWKLYLIEGWALGIFMIAASTVVILLEHPEFYLTDIIPSALIRRILIALAMGLTAISLIYSPWGKLSGAHMNPAVTLANYQLNRITLADTIWYIIFQCMGSVVAMLLYSFLFKNYLSYPSVNFIVTQPGSSGIFAATFAEFIMAFIMFLMVLISSNSKYAAYTGYFAGILVFLFIGLEAPISGMSINPARSLGSAFSSGMWHSFWIYIIAPVAGMQAAAFGYRRWYFNKMGECKTMDCFMSGEENNNKIYHVWRWSQRKKDGLVALMHED